MNNFSNKPVSSDTDAYAHNAQIAADVLLTGKWQVQVLCAMRRGPVRIGQLGRLIPGASNKVLAQRLRKLEAEGIVVRKKFGGLILHVEYELQVDVRESVNMLLDRLSEWGRVFDASE